MGIISRDELKKDYLKKIRREKTILSPEQIKRQSKPIKNYSHGVYFLINHGKIVYIGKTTRGEIGVWEHYGEKPFNRYTFIRCRPEEVDSLEQIYIEKYRPTLNIVNNKNNSNKQKRSTPKQFGYRSVYNYNISELSKDDSEEVSKTI